MALKIYGVARSRTARVLWMARELGLDYEHIKVDFATGETRQPAHLALNPNGHVPVIDDDGFILWESMAINLYLARKYGTGGLYPSHADDEARAWQWSFWGITEIERPLLTALLNRAFYPESQRDAATADAAEKTLAQPLGVLDGALGSTPYLLGDKFTVADLNPASVLAWARPARIDLSAFPKVAEWLKNCAERPAARAVRQLQRE
jgi:glutathione S-transferase